MLAAENIRSSPRNLIRMGVVIASAASPRQGLLQRTAFEGKIMIGMTVGIMTVGIMTITMMEAGVRSIVS